MEPQVIETASHILLSISIVKQRIPDCVSCARRIRNRLRLHDLPTVFWPPFQWQPLILPTYPRVVKAQFATFFGPLAPPTSPRAHRLTRATPVSGSPRGGEVKSFRTKGQPLVRFDPRRRTSGIRSTPDPPPRSSRSRPPTPTSRPFLNPERLAST